MAFKKDYYERKQIKHRAKYGKLEKRTDLLARLNKKKEQKKIISSVKNDIENVTGKEYFFKFHSIDKKNGKVCKILYDQKDELKKKMVFVDNEIIRIENKLKSYAKTPSNRRFVFDDNGNKNEITQNIETNVKEELLEYETYLKQLIETKKEIFNKLS